MITQKWNSTWALSLLVLGLLTENAFSVTKVGNGDGGSDLEGAILVTEGPLIDSRREAVKQLLKLNISGIRGLGTLLPEVEQAKIYLTKKDSEAMLPSDEGSFHTNLNGLVYARTFCESHAPTRFFPVALALASDQLIALHIHEGLHRALPAPFREDEAIVSRITLAITSAEASHDRVALAVKDVLPQEDFYSIKKEEEHFQTPSNIGYSFRQFLKNDHLLSYPIDRMHILQSDLYPFGGVNSPIGLGIEASFINRPGQTEAGPLGLSAKARLWSHRGFDIGLFGQTYLNVLSAEELKNSPFGRDIFTLGISMRKDLNLFYVENFLSYTFEGTSQRNIGRVNYTYQYGGIINAKVRAGAKFHGVDLGGFAELHLAENFAISGGAFNEAFGRYRIFSMGPEMSYSIDTITLGAGGRFLVESTKGANFDYLGNLMGPGVSQGGVYATAKFHF